MKRGLALILAAGVLFCSWPAGTVAAAGEELAEAAATDPAASSGNNIVTTKHQAVIQGKTVSYTAETGTMTMESGGNSCEIFYVAYTRDDADGDKARPITFAFNGGPGASSYCVQFCLGPRRPELDDEGFALDLPSKLVDNGNSILDMSDLVFIDPVGTGYSVAADEAEEDEFFGYRNDVVSVGDFIRLYINRHKRWASPKYIAGESYGTTRAVGLCDYLASRYAMYVNGLMLISSVNDYGAVIANDGNDTPYALSVPTFAANAWYHGKLSGEYQKLGLEEYLEQVRTFVEEEYVPALFIGKGLTKDKKEKIAQKLADYIGVSKDYVLKCNLRVPLEDFSTELLSDEKLMIGRYDGRVTGPVTDGNLNTGENDPSASNVDIAFFSTYMNYITEELQFETDRPYVPVSLEVNYSWSLMEDDGPISQESMISDCMSHNPFLKVWVLCGYYDNATPFYSAEWAYNHVFLSGDREDNLSFTYYPSGHMIYIDKASFDKFRKDAEKWYAE